MNQLSAITCPQCGRIGLPDDRFCGRCGMRLPHAPDAAADDRAGAPFVGRQRELNALHVAVARSRAGQGRIVLMRGEAGVGKTRIAEETARAAAHQGLRVVWGRCSEDDGAPPYWPWIQAMRAYVDAAGADELARAAGIAAGSLVAWLPELAARLPSVLPPPRIDDAVQARFRLFDAIATFWKRAAGLHPLLLVLDDLHRADAASLGLLAFVAPEVGSSALLVLATCRDESSGDDAFAATQAELMRLPSFQRIELRGLTLTETAQFVSSTTGLRSPALAAELHQRTEGNPLFLVEMTRLVTAGADDARDEEAARTRLDALPLPDGVRETIGARLRKLSPPCRQMLDGASLIGRVFAIDVLARVVGAELDAALAEARAAKLVEPLAGTPGHHRFGHMLMRDVIEAQLPAAQRSELHLRVAEALEAVHARDLGPQLAALAHHRAAALPLGDARRAAALAQQAAERAMSLYASDAAARLYRLALRLEPQRDGASTSALLLALGSAEVAAGEHPNARATFERAAALARHRGDEVSLARAALGFEEAVWRPGVADAGAVPLLREAIDRLDDLHAYTLAPARDPSAQDVGPAAERPRGGAHTTLKVQLTSALTRALIFAGQAPQAESVAAAAVALARASGDVQALIGALACGLSARWLPARLPARLAAAAEAMALARDSGDIERELECACWHLFDLIEQEVDAPVRQLLDEHDRLTDALRQPFYRYVNLSLRSLLAAMRGDFADAEWFALRGLEVGGRLPGIDAAGVFGLQMFGLRREQGRLAEVAPLLRPFVESTPQARIWLPGLALLYAEIGEPERARAAFERVLSAGFEPVPRDAMWLASAVHLAETCVALGDAPRAAMLYHALEPYRGRNLMVGSSVACGAADRVLGMLAATERRWPIALRHFDDAIAKDERQQAAAWLAHDRHQLAVALLARGAAGDRARAAQLLDLAGAAARQLGMVALSRRIDAVAPSAEGAALLSEREIGVLRLVAQGRSNRDIAAELRLSPNTVANHLRRILGRTGCSNRAEAAAFAMRQGLIDAPRRVD